MTQLSLVAQQSEPEPHQAAARVAALEAELQELCAAARAPAQRNWLRFAREALRKLGPPHRFAVLRCALQDRQASLRQQRQVLEKRLEENGLPPLGEGEEFLQELQAELQDLQLGGRQWRHRLQETATKLGDRGRRLSFSQQFCPAERELLRLQAELQHAQGTSKETQEAELQQLREEVAALEKAEEEAKAAASLGSKGNRLGPAFDKHQRRRLPAAAPGNAASAEKIEIAGLSAKMVATPGPLNVLGSFDTIVSLLCIHHIRDCEAQLRELATHLSPSGRIVVIDFEATENARLFHKKSETRGDHYEHDGLEADALHGWLTSAGLQNVEVHRAPFEKARAEGWEDAGRTETFQMLIASGSRE
ncbi:unnamed protein product [Symbiodinium sp. CCMP2456]|nr:unnamed protein product [Symbiodinium sp. CCMP2456]